MKKATLLASLLTLPLLSGCLEKEKLTDIGDAENILFTSQGDLLVTGGKSIYQIDIQSDSDGAKTYAAKKVYNGPECSFAGIAQDGDWIFTVCGKPYIKWQGWTFKAGIDTQLMAANIHHEGNLEFKRLDEEWSHDPLDSLIIPNGLAFTPDGKLLIADENLLGQGSVGRITLDYSGEWPSIAHFEKDFIGAEFGVSSPNGVRVANNTVYVSNENKVQRFVLDHQFNVPLEVIQEDGTLVSNASDESVLYEGGLIVDDIMPICGGVALTSFFEGQLAYVSPTGQVHKTAPLNFDSPSAIAIGQGPHFDGHDLLVTEKGVLLDSNSRIGNQLSRVRFDFDLSESNTCSEINDY